MDSRSRDIEGKTTAVDLFARFNSCPARVTEMQRKSMRVSSRSDGNAESQRCPKEMQVESVIVQYTYSISIHYLYI